MYSSGDWILPSLIAAPTAVAIIVVLMPCVFHSVVSSCSAGVGLEDDIVIASARRSARGQLLIPEELFPVRQT